MLKYGMDDLRAFFDGDVRWLKHYGFSFLDQNSDKIKGATSKALLVRDADVQVLHGFDSLENAQAYLKSQLFNEDVVTKLKPLLDAEPEVRFYTVAA